MEVHRMNLRSRFKKKLTNTHMIQPDDTNHSSPIKCLNYYCLVIIFENLPILDRVRCERVCKLWCEASRGSWHNFRKLDLDASTWGRPVKKTSDYFSLLDKVLPRCGEYVTHIDLSMLVPSVPQRTNSLGMLTKCPNLKELNLKNFKLGVPQMKFLSTHCENIELLALSLHQLTKNCDDALLENCLTSKLNLRTLHLILSKRRFRGTFFERLSPDFIEEVNLESCSNFDLKLMTTTIPTFTKLHTLKLSGSLYDYYRIYPEQMRRQDIVTLFRNLSALKNLKVLDVSRNYRYIDDKAVSELIGLRDNLKSLDISRTCIGDRGLSVITTSSSLENLTMQSLWSPSGAGLGNMPNLLSLDCFSSIRMEESNLIRVLNSSEKLEKLNISFCKKVTKNLVNAARNVTAYRVNDVNLKIVALGTGIDRTDVPSNAPLLKIQFQFFL